MAKPDTQKNSQCVIGVFKNEFDASYAIDKLVDLGFEASPIPMDRAKSYRPSIQSDEIVVAVTCGDRCDIAQSFLTDYGASDVASASPQAIQGAKARGVSATSILTPQDTERVIDIDGVIEVKEGPYVEPDMVDVGDIG